MDQAATDKMDKAKRAAGDAAAAEIEEKMIVGLGTGSTAHYFISALGKRCREGLTIKAVATSLETEELARKEAIPLADIDRLTHLDIVCDGADEIDEKKRMIKGGGGALLREKIVAAMSREVVVIVDETKCVKRLGAFPLPVEIVPFAYLATIARLEERGYKGGLRRKQDSSLYVTDGGHYIYDVSLNGQVNNPEKINSDLLEIPGVLETGFFLNLAGRVIIGKNDGGTIILS